MPRTSTSMPRIVLQGTTPDKVSGLLLWLKADAGAYSDAGTTLATNGQTVRQWNDQSGNGNNVSQSTAGSRPTYTTNLLNGYPGLSFDGGDNIVVVGTNFDLSTYTMFVVAKNTSGAGSFIGKGDTGTGAGGRRKLNLSYATNLLKYFSGSDSAVTQITITTTSDHIFNVRAIATNSTIIQIDEKKYPQSGTFDYTTFNTQTLNIGSGFNAAEFFNGVVYEVIIFNTAINESDNENVMRYLSFKYGISGITLSRTLVP